MKKLFVVIFLGVVMSFFFYPISFTFLPSSLNTKMMLAVLGAIMFVYTSLKSHTVLLSRDTLYAAIIAVVFSVVCYFSTVINNTNDSSYTSYVVSFFVWFFAAYSVCELLRSHYGVVSLRIITMYLTWVAVAQCILSQMIDNIPSFQILVDSIVSGNSHVRELDRLYGIGASLDTAGVRFSVTLLLLSFFIVKAGESSESVGELWGYYFSFIVITVLGNMISRTTSVGSIIGLGYILLYAVGNMSQEVKANQLKSVAIILIMLGVLIPLGVYLYNTNANVHSNLRFAFEGFFNWIEYGEWRTDSTDKLNAVMWVWPKDVRTWIIGSGLFDGWVYSTDIGYCRFILYCGIVGFSIFSFFFAYNAYAFSQKFDNVVLLAFLLLCLTFVIWLKVSTDIFLIYALLLCADDIVDDSEIDDEEELEEIEG